MKNKLLIERLYQELVEKSSALTLTEVLGRYQLCHQTPQPPTTSSRPQNPKLLALQIRGARIVPLIPILQTPPPIRESPTMPFQNLPINLVENRVVLLELPGKRAVAQHHSSVIFEAEGPGMLLRGRVPGDVVEVVVDRGVSVILGVAYESLEVSFGRGDEVCVVEEKCSWEIVPTHYAVLCEGS